MPGGRASPRPGTEKFGAGGGQRAGAPWAQVAVHLCGAARVPPPSAPPSTSWTARPSPVAVTRARAAILAVLGGHCSWCSSGPEKYRPAGGAVLVCGCRGWGSGGTVLVCKVPACGGRCAGLRGPGLGEVSLPEEGCWSGSAGRLSCGPALGVGPACRVTEFRGPSGPGQGGGGTTTILRWKTHSTVALVCLTVLKA